MTREEIVAACERQAQAWGAHDDQAVAACFASDASLRDAGGQTISGREAIAARAKQYMDAFPDMRLDIESIEVEGNRFTMEWKAVGTNTASLGDMPATHKSIVVEGCDVGEFGDDGLIQRETDYWNEASFLRQLGMMPEPAAA
jgi:steroid delta-isomerase-like uncharacterized protein